MNIKNSVCDLIGNTPLLCPSRFARAEGADARLLVKLEYLNPGGSVKDRTALAMIRRAEREGTLINGGTVIEPTSGNTGIALAALAAALGFSLVVTMPDTMSVERRRMIECYGARVVLTDGALGMKGAAEMAEELRAQIPDAVTLGQFDDPANPDIHYRTTGPELWRDCDGEIDALVAGVGTGGTLCGAGRFLKEQKPTVRVFAVEPAASPVLSGGARGAHGIQGIGAGFVPAVFDRSVCDGVLCVTDGDAKEYAKRFARTEGISVGISSGAALAAATALARDYPKDKTIAVILADSGDRYLS